jgi:hypothetical protein
LYFYYIGGRLIAPLELLAVVPLATLYSATLASKDKILLEFLALFLKGSAVDFLFLISHGVYLSFICALIIA